MNEVCEVKELAVRELTLDEVESVSGGGMISDIIDRVVAIYHFYTGTITDHATTLP